MRVVQSNSVVEWKAMPGVEIRLYPEVRASFSSCVADRGTWDSGSAHMMFGPVKDVLRERVEQCGEWERENQLLFCYWSRSV